MRTESQRENFYLHNESFTYFYKDYKLAPAGGERAWGIIATDIQFSFITVHISLVMTQLFNFVFIANFYLRVLFCSYLFNLLTIQKECQRKLLFVLLSSFYKLKYRNPCDYLIIKSVFLSFLTHLSLGSTKGWAGEWWLAPPRSFYQHLSFSVAVSLSLRHFSKVL